MAQKIATADDGARLTENGIDLTDSHLTIEDYRVEDHTEIVAETDDVVVVRDTNNHELNEWAKAFDISRSDLSEQMHNLARKHYGRDEAQGTGDPWSVTDPLVLVKTEE